MGHDSGSAYVFTRSGTTWTHQQKLLPSDGSTEDYFGGDVFVSGDTALIGAVRNDDMGVDSGSAYIFVLSTGVWQQMDKLIPADGEADERFGCEVAISGGIALVGAWWDNDNGNESGSAYVFE